ncbi:multidrug effflux MFS transporter [Luteolibacter pohnpeiensis]|uniref:Multidrug effflux MFS transporter n=1 Tax=Luteolibacter pohnpeiensis TaxID=454153 RepID=A0A934S7S2_9BACT|nr:multidrug effflux MFS transporter [Luteolibacter pohnpeiensis]MBK1884261.1 multidrug effflux MFS transporter [Luteolibacter pohnpeiensis]
MDKPLPILTESPTAKPGKMFIPILAWLMGFTSLSTDVYLPAMPTMQSDLHGNVELTVTGFLIGFAAAQIFWGPFSDRYGRKLPLAIGLILFVIGSMGCALSNTMIAIVSWRIIQAFGACTGPMIARAMVRDTFAKTEAARVLSGLMILMAIAPIVGPLLGGQILVYSTWHAIFWFLGIVGTIMFFSQFLLPETHPLQRRSDHSIGQAFRNYLHLLGNARFMRYTLCVTFFYVAVFAFIAGSPAVYIRYFHVSEQNYGWLFAVNVVGLMGFSMLNRKLVTLFNLDYILRISTLISMTSAIVLLIMVLLNFGGLLAVVIGIFFFFAMNGFIAACSTAAALDDVPEIAGAASALLGSLQYGSGIVSTLLLSFFGNETPVTMSWIIAIFTTLAALLMKPWLWNRNRRLAA